MSGPAGCLATGWSLIREHIKTEDPLPLDKYLGCTHRVQQVPYHMLNPSMVALLTQTPPTTTKVPKDSPSSTQLAQPGGISYVAAGAPEQKTRGELHHLASEGRVANVITWDMGDFLSQCVKLYLELAGPGAATLRKVSTPFIEQAAEKELDEPLSGVLAPTASRVPLKILYAARMARFDLLRATCYLATRITKWSKQCDRMLHRLVAYINSTLDVYMTGWIADPPE